MLNTLFIFNFTEEHVFFRILNLITIFIKIRSVMLPSTINVSFPLNSLQCFILFINSIVNVLMLVKFIL